MPRVPLLQIILETLEEDYEEYCRSGFAPVRRYWLQYEAGTGMPPNTAMAEVIAAKVHMVEDMTPLATANMVTVSSKEVNLLNLIQ